MSRYLSQRVGVLYGGPSSERAVSLRSGQRVVEALGGAGYTVVGFDWKDSVEAVLQALRSERIDVVFLALHGPYGEDGCIQGLLECCGLPYTGSSVLASALAMDKAAAKRVFEGEAIETPRWTVHRGAADVLRIGLPLVVKPAREGSSVGISIVHDESELPAALEKARAAHGPVLLEEYVKGREIQVAVLDGEVLGDVEIHPAGEFYDYAAKYERSDTTYTVPAALSTAERRLCHDLARRAHRSLGCAGVTRTDLLLTPSGRAVCLEVDTLPGLTARSLVPMIAAANGIEFLQLCEKILDGASLKN